MRLNVRPLMAIEPVALDSQVAQLIREAKAPRPPETKETPEEVPKPRAGKGSWARGGNGLAAAAKSSLGRRTVVSRGDAGAPAT